MVFGVGVRIIQENLNEEMIVISDLYVKTDSDEENIPTEKEDKDSDDGNVSAKIDEEIKNLLEKSTDGYFCKVCGKTGRMRFHLHRHIETHLDGYSHPCNQCKAVMPTRNARVQHIRLKHKNRNRNKY